MVSASCILLHHSQPLSLFLHNHPLPFSTLFKKPPENNKFRAKVQIILKPHKYKPQKTPKKICSAPYFFTFCYFHAPVTLPDHPSLVTFRHIYHNSSSFCHAHLGGGTARIVICRQAKGARLSHRPQRTLPINYVSSI